jgi:hypothetical protein
VKERFERPHSANESPDSSSAADDLIAKESPDSSSAANGSITKEGPDSSSVGGDNNETLLSSQKSDSAQPTKPLSSRKPETNWADESSDDSEKDVNMDKESVIGSSSTLADYSIIREEINPGFAGLFARTQGSAIRMAPNT